MMYFVLTVAIVLNALANIFMKMGMNKVGGLDMRPPLSWFLNMLANPFILMGLFCFGLGLVAYNYVLSQINLSIAYPIMTSIGYCIVIVVSWLFLQEKIVPVQVFGFSLIIAGVWMVAG